MNRNGLDEMQLQKRNKIGNQTLMLLFYLLMIDICLHGFGLKWLEYPVNIFVISIACMTCYAIRIIWNNAYLGLGSNINKKAGIYISVIAVVVASVTLYMSFSNIEKVQVLARNDITPIILFVASVISIIISIIIQIIAYWRNKKTDG